jgi:hypothetical protein
MYCLHHILKIYDLTQIGLSVWVVESVGLPKFEFSPTTEKVPRTIKKERTLENFQIKLRNNLGAANMTLHRKGKV